ncbi:MAG: hypothetical protein ACREQ5_06380 [Candidatus Dormibacteria bacterium]
MNGNTWRKIAFYGGAVAIVSLKIYGIFAKDLKWWMVIALAGMGIITEPEVAAADTLDAARAKGYLQ